MGLSPLSAEAGTGRIYVVGLGPGNPAQITLEASTILGQVAARYLRTVRHPSAAAAMPATSFDSVYDGAASMDEVYETIVESLVRAARVHGTIAYAVPGSPLVAERTVELLRAEQRVEVEIVASLSFLDLVWARLGVDPVATGVHLVDGHRFLLDAAGQAGPLLVAQADSLRVLSEIKLSLEDGPDVVVLQRLGLFDEAVQAVAWDDLDRVVVPDHLTSIWIPTLASPVATEIVRLDELTRRLRQECPWDRGQTHRSLARHLLEETYEVLEAIDELPAPPLNRSAAAHAVGSDEGRAPIELIVGDQAYGHLEEELGDVLFQVVLHATLAAEVGAFDLSDVARGVHDKLVSRHPHVFAGVEAGDASTMSARWEDLKKLEKDRTSIMDGLPANLPALLYASKIQRKVASSGLVEGRPVTGPGASVADGIISAVRSIAELLSDVSANGGDPKNDPLPASERVPDAFDRIGGLLLSVVDLARHLDVDPETALAKSSGRFRREFMQLEARAGEDKSGDGGSPAETSGTVGPTNHISHTAISQTATTEESAAES